MKVIGLISALVLVIATALGLLIGRSIMGPLNRMNVLMDDIALGAVTDRLCYTGISPMSSNWE